MPDDDPHPLVAEPPWTAGDTVEIRARGLAKAFGAREVLAGIDLEIRSGEIVGIVGASGSGKTVLLHCLIGLIPISRGTVEVADHARGHGYLDLARLSTDELDEVRRTWSVVMQRNALFSDSVYENCAVWLREHTRLSEGEIEARIREALAAAGLDVDDVISKHRDALSGGMAKRVAVARALVADPYVIFYDEPTTGLDPVSAARIHDLIWATHFRPRADGKPRTTVLVTHDRDLLRRLHPRVVMLDGGRPCFDGPYAEFRRTAAPQARQYLAEMPALHARPVTP
jgi:phospholipid/cholesterol/gamma-HCH transport system ATP-binding protein